MTDGDRASALHIAYATTGTPAATGVWISTLPQERAQTLTADALARRDAGELLPLCGVPFGIKDNIDLEGLPTTAACPDFAYTPERSAHAVERLLAAGAIPVGKTNLDQFATGLNGTRTPYPVPRNPFDPARVPGGSSSGSAVAVAAGLVPFSLGTDTAGSGRVPAAFNNIVGFKPTRGLVSARGVVPACRSLDCVSVFANTVAEALDVLRVMAGFDAEDPFSRPAPPRTLAAGPEPASFRFGVPGDAALAPCDAAALHLFRAAASRLRALGGTEVVIDFAPFQEAASLLYAGPWVAERLAAIREFFAQHPDSLDPSVRQVIGAAAQFDATDAFEGHYRLAALRRRAEREWAAMDLMLLPTAPLCPTVDAIRSDPIGLNAALGVYTNFVNLLDLAAVAVPAGFTPDGLPFGLTLVGPAFSDGPLALLADRLHRTLADEATLGASRRTLGSTPRVAAEPDESGLLLAVVGAHLSGEPLNPDLVAHGGRFVRTTRTEPGYSLYLLADAVPAKPGLVRDGGPGRLEVEVWRLPVEGFGAFVAEIPPPLGIGRIALADGTAVPGFLCEAHATQAALNITSFGGWRAFVRSAFGR